MKEKSIVHHKVYGEGIVAKIEEGKIYVKFGKNQIRIFDYPMAFDKAYLKL